MATPYDCPTCHINVVAPQAPIPLRSRHDEPRYCPTCGRLFPPLERS